MTAGDFVRRSADARLHGTSQGDGPLVLLLHAGRERRQVWFPVMDELTAHHRLRCVAVDQRGHGDSTGVATDLRSFGLDVENLLGDQREPCVIVGSSLGGMAAMTALAARHVRSVVAGLVLVDVVPDPDPEVARRYLGGRGLLEGGNPLVEDILAAGPRLRATVAAADLPVQLVRGGRSKICDDAAVERLRDAAGSLRVDEVPGAGHLVAHDAPVELARAIGPVVAGWLGSRPLDRRSVPTDRR